MKNLLVLIIAVVCVQNCLAQDDVYPAKPELGTYYITNGTLHIGNGQVVEKGTIEVKEGKISRVGQSVVPAQGARVINAEGQQIYPGLILPVTDLGLKEIGSGVRGSNDFSELGDYNPSVRSAVAYNTDSKVINTLRSNGILLACVTPQGGTISGSSSVVQLDAWNWEDALYKADNAIHLNMPTFLPAPTRSRVRVQQVQDDPSKKAIEKLEEIKSFFSQAKAYSNEKNHEEVNLKFQAIRGLFNKSQKLFVHADQVKQMLAALDIAETFGFDMVLVGASESWQIADLLKQHNVAVILNEQHALPASEDDDYDQPYKTPSVLAQAGVLFALNDNNSEPRYRNLAFNAGTAAAYGLGKEGALQAITLNAAKILGIADRTGSLETGKDANIVISSGDILDMRTSQVTRAIIQGRSVNLDNKQRQLYERYKFKYDLK